LLGPNGAGKSTTLKLSLGLMEPAAGAITLLGEPIPSRGREARVDVGVVPQNDPLDPDFTVAENLLVFGRYFGQPDSLTRSRIDPLLEFAQLQSKRNARIQELSGGMKRRLTIARALINDPQVLFLDEPTIGLDVIAQHKIQQFLKHYQQVRRITILLTSHYMKDIAALCQRVVVIAGGLIQYDGSLSGIIDQFSSDKIVTLQLGKDEDFAGLEKFPGIVELQPPKFKFRVGRDDVAKTLGQLLSTKQIDDIVVEDPPLEEVIAAVFTKANADSAASNPTRD
jgi:ABC-2 type transport system ATP-binding protein